MELSNWWKKYESEIRKIDHFCKENGHNYDIQREGVLSPLYGLFDLLDKYSYHELVEV